MKKVALFLLFTLLGCGVSPLTKTTHPEKKPENAIVDGVDVGSAGQGLAGEFVQVGYELVEILMANPIAGISTQDLFHAVQTTSIVAVKNLKLRGEPRDAANFAKATPPRIEFDEDFWKKAKRHIRVLVVFHEYLGIMEINDRGYQVSRRIDRANLCSRTDVVRQAIEEHFQKSCYRILVDDLTFLRELDLSSSDLKSLKSSDFDALHSLEFLDLSSNPLESLPAGIFKDLETLKFLSLRETALKEIQSNSFQGLSSLWTLDLSHSKIQTLHPSAFAGLDAISRVSTTLPSPNELKEKKKPNPTVVYLTGNALKTIRRGFLEGFKGDFVDFSGVELQEFELGAFQGASLEYLLLKGQPKVVPGSLLLAERLTNLSLRIDTVPDMKLLQEINSHPKLREVRFSCPEDKSIAAALSTFKCSAEVGGGVLCKK